MIMLMSINTETGHVVILDSATPIEEFYVSYHPDDIGAI